MYNQKTPGKTSSKLNKEQSDQYNNQDFYRRSLSTFDLDGSDVVDYSMMQRTASVMLTDTYERNSSILDFAASPQTRVMDKKKMKDMDVTFKNKAAWKKDNVCSVCSKNVDSGRHHCRLCASTVCGSCSNRKINDKRVCDTCFYKKKLEVQEKRMDDSLAKMDDTVKETNNMLRRIKENYVQEQERCRQFEKQVQQEAAMQEESKEKQSKVKYGFLNNLNKAKEINQNLNSGIEKNKTDIAEKESKLRSLRTKLATLNLDVSQKKQKYQDLSQKFDSLLQKHRSINEGRMSESVISEIAPGSGPGPAIVAKNYSILGNDKGGKYNISVKPVNI